ncbi:uncharacterized protein LODBEIA_P04090 [Lodderomyces beijingensis]|uniref:HMG box domain-containing protein n=1 Tax=Lodderomyces beijingensis TaxID=1775926 RepID=A0ABP0ZG86_9ASCO
MNPISSVLAGIRGQTVTRTVLQQRFVAVCTSYAINRTPFRTYAAGSSGAQLKSLIAKVKKAKDKSKQLQKELKEAETKIKAAVKERTKKAAEKKQEMKEAEARRKLVAKATVNPRAYSPLVVFCKSKKLSIKDAVPIFAQISEEERSKWTQATADLNSKIRPMVTPRPKSDGTTSFSRFVKKNIADTMENVRDGGVEGRDVANTAFRQLGEKWRAMDENEKSRYAVSKEERARAQQKKKDWQELRVKEYHELQKFLKEYKVNIEDY